MTMERRTPQLKNKYILDFSDGPSETPPKGFGVRHLQVALIYLGMVNYGNLFFSLSLGLVGMDDTTGSSGPVLNYTIADQGTISGLFVFGLMVGEIPAGYLVTAYAPMRLMSVGALLTGVLQVLFPSTAINLGFTTTCILRALIGLTQCFANPASIAHFSKWVTEREKDRFSFVWGGKFLGYVVIIAISAIVMSYLGGWPAIFYASGILSIIWGVSGLLWSVESISKHPTITTVEKDFLEANITNKGKTTIKWKALFTSVPVWTVIVVRACSHWTSIVMASLIPLFFTNVLKLSVNYVTFATAGLYLTMIVSSYGCAFIANKLDGHVSPKVSRILWNTIGMGGGSVPLFFLYMAEDYAVVLILIYYILAAAEMLGHKTNIIEVAPSHSGMIASAAGFLSNLFAFTGPIFAGYIIKDEEDMMEWWKKYNHGITTSNEMRKHFLLVPTSMNMNQLHQANITSEKN
ncbi:hypothetical protein GE061_011080 [Apolygus lucorum]|uniref:Major facilitator superfamily (MFS) profile domain-containing protein n=1 Tax=Apolygus lucorum TaxID=248454 RepID=A0A6A4INP5_APOLU|nr:hypothetical protein GE061_011080 [Apolygus lucorum]